MTDDKLSEVNMVSLVRDILNGKDLSKVTPRTVREEVISRLGTEVATDAVALKASVKSALDIVLTDTLNQQENHDEPFSGDDKLVKRAEKHGKDEKPGNQQPEEDGSDHAMDEDDEHASASEDEDEESVQRSKRVSTTTKREPAQRPQKRARVSTTGDSQFKSDADFNRLKRVCRQIGCPVPPSRQKGSTMREKCANVLGFLQSKGVTDRDPTRLRKEELNAHRKRIEREKDLEGLDVSNIIEDEGRPRRRRAAAPVVNNEELPSDLSGPELSEQSEDEGEEFAISDADSE